MVSTVHAPLLSIPPLSVCACLRVCVCVQQHVFWAHFLIMAELILIFLTAYLPQFHRRSLPVFVCALTFTSLFSPYLLHLPLCFRISLTATTSQQPPCLPFASLLTFRFQIPSPIPVIPCLELSTGFVIKCCSFTSTT